MRNALLPAALVGLVLYFWIAQWEPPARTGYSEGETLLRPYSDRLETWLKALPGGRTAGRFVKRFFTDDVGLMAGALAYQFFLALFPFAIFVTAISSALARALGLPDVSQVLFTLAAHLPPGVATVLLQELQTIVGSDAPRLLSVSAAGTLWAATYGMSTLLVTMDRAYDAPAARRRAVRILIAGGLTLLAGWALVGLGLVIAIASILGPALVADAGLSEDLFDLDVTVIWLAVMALAFVAAGAVYRLAPNVSQPWWGALPGAALFAVAWVVGTIGFSIYLGTFATYGITYGALAGVVSLLVWLYLTAYLFLAGAVLNAVLVTRPARPGEP